MYTNAVAFAHYVRVAVCSSNVVRERIHVSVSTSISGIMGVIFRNTHTTHTLNVNVCSMRIKGVIRTKDDKGAFLFVHSIPTKVCTW